MGPTFCNCTQNKKQNFLRHPRHASTCPILIIVPPSLRGLSAGFCCYYFLVLLQSFYYPLCILGRYGLFLLYHLKNGCVFSGSFNLKFCLILLPLAPPPLPPTKSTTWIFLVLILEGVLHVTLPQCLESPLSWLAMRIETTCPERHFYTYHFLEKDIKYTPMIILEGRKMRVN